VTRVAWQILPATLLLQLGGAMAQINQNLPVLGAGDPLRGEAIVSSRQTGLCLLCHSAPVGDARFQGNLAPSLAGAGKRWTAAQLRQRVANPRSLNPDSIMPAYASTDGLNRVGSAWVGQPLLTGQQIEDVVAFLLTLQE
jgi:sulfur-oxidizing protein SoxX